LHGTAQAQGINNFVIESFSADYRIGRDDRGVSTLDVQETIVALFPETDQNHGILRAIPRQYEGRSLQLKIKNVTNEHGTPLKFDTYRQNNNEVLKIGDPDRFVHGRTTYVITYTMREVVRFEQDHDEFYWDINGDEWPQVIGNVTARIHVPAELAGSLQERQRCFAGSFGATRQNCSIVRSSNNGGVIITATSGRLQGYETLTVVLAFDDATFMPDKLAALRRKLKIAAIVSSLAVPPLVAGLIVWRKWHRHGRDPKGRGVIVPQYLPPKQLNPVLAELVLNEKLGNKAVTATIIDLAVKKYILISELDVKPKDYELALLKTPSNLAAEQLSVLKMFFGQTLQKGDTVKLSTLKSKLYKEVQKLGLSASSRVHALGYFT